MASLDVASLSLEPVVPKGGGVIKCWRTEAAEVKERWPGEVKITQASGAWLGLLYSTHIFKGAGLWEPGRARGWCISLVALSSSAFSSNHRISPFRAFRPSKAPSHFPYRWPSSAPSRTPAASKWEIWELKVGRRKQGGSSYFAHPRSSCLSFLWVVLVASLCTSALSD